MLFMTRSSKFAWLLMFACSTALAETQTLQTGTSGERPIGLPSNMVYLADAY